MAHLPMHIPIVLVLCLLRHDEVHQVGIEGPVFELLRPDGPLLADAAQPQDLHLAVDVDPAPPSEAAEAPTTILFGIAVASLLSLFVLVDRKGDEGKEDEKNLEGRKRSCGGRC